MMYEGDRMRAADRGGDPLAPARGVMVGSVLGMALWGLVAFLVLAVWL